GDRPRQALARPHSSVVPAGRGLTQRKHLQRRSSATIERAASTTTASERRPMPPSPISMVWLPSVTVVAACLALPLTGPPPAAAAPLEGVPAFGHVFLIVGENASVSEITPRHAPYITGTLRPGGAWLTRYFALADGSLADYAAMVSGQFVRCERNNDFSF